jgi:hypothetical protein
MSTAHIEGKEGEYVINCDVTVSGGNFFAAVGGGDVPQVVDFSGPVPAEVEQAFNEGLSVTFIPGEGGRLFNTQNNHVVESNEPITILGNRMKGQPSERPW